MNSMWTVMSFTMRNKLRSKSFLVTTIILGLLLVVGGNVPTLIDKFAGGGGPTKVGYAAGEQADVVKGMEAVFGAAKEPDVELVPIAATGSADEKAAAMKQAIADKKIKGYLTFADNAAVGFPDVTYYSKKLLDTGTAQTLQTALAVVKNAQAVAEAKLTPAEQAKLAAPVKLSTVQISDSANGKTEAEQGTVMGLTYVLLILLFISVMISGQLIANEITAEKSSRVMEIIVTSVSPLKQLFGKVIGTFLVSLLQLVVLVGAGVGSLFMPSNANSLDKLGVRLDSIEPRMLVFAAIFYLIGFFLYAMLFATVGSIVSRTEDLGQAVMPITLITLAGFYIAIFGMTNPDSTLITVCSYIPFFSPFIMFLRIGLTDTAWWEPVLSVAILAASVLVIGWLSAKIYRAGVLMYGKRPSMKELIKAMRAFNV